MNRIEMNTIAEALVKKRSWIKKGFQNFLGAWKESTKDMIDLPRRFKEIEVYKEETYNSHGEEVTLRYVITAGEDGLEFYRQTSSYPEDEIDYSNMGAETIKAIMAGDLPGKIWDHFKKIQSSIDDLNITESRINELIEKLA